MARDVTAVVAVHGPSWLGRRRKNPPPNPAARSGLAWDSIPRKPGVSRS